MRTCPYYDEDDVYTIGPTKEQYRQWWKECQFLLNERDKEIEQLKKALIQENAKLRQMIRNAGACLQNERLGL